MTYVLILPIFGCVFLSICAVALVLSVRGERWHAWRLFAGALGTIPGFLAGNAAYWIVSWIVSHLGAAILWLFPAVDRWLYDSWATSPFLIVVALGGAAGLCLANVMGVACGFFLGARESGQIARVLGDRRT